MTVISDQKNTKVATVEVFALDNISLKPIILSVFKFDVSFAA